MQTPEALAADPPEAGQTGDTARSPLRAALDENPSLPILVLALEVLIIYALLENADEFA